MEEEPQPDMHRRLAAILSADAVGYSRLMGDDDVATVHTLSICRTIIVEIVVSSEGRVVDSPGDNILAEFGSAVDAVKAASAIQIRLGTANAERPEHRRMAFRIGVNLGDVLVEDGRIYGDGVNVAARLEAQAGPGGVLISSSIYDQVRGKVAFDFVDRGKLDLKNIPEPVHAYALEIGTPVHQMPAQSAARNRHLMFALLGAGIVAVIVIAGGMWHFLVADRAVPVEAAGTGLASNPSEAPLYASRGEVEISLGRFEQARSDTQQAMQLSPGDPLFGSWRIQLGDAELGLKHFDASIDEYRGAIDAGSRPNISYARLAAAYALAGKMDEAKSALAEARRIDPGLTVKWLIAHSPDIPLLFEGARKAGLPEDRAVHDFPAERSVVESPVEPAVVAKPNRPLYR